jgi:hypothetical protein
MARPLAALPALALLALSAALAVPARSEAWPPLQTAGPFLQAKIEDQAHGRYAKVWTELYPAHRAIVPESVYVACERHLPLVAPLRGLRIAGVRPVPVRVAGLREPVPGVAVEVRVSVKWYGRDPMSFTHTFHLVPVGGHWTWILSPQRYRLYSATGCGLMPAA